MPRNGAACFSQFATAAFQRVGERLVARLIIGGVFGVELGEPRRERAGDATDIARIGLDVRIARGVDIPFGPVEARRLFEQRHVRRRLEISGLAGLDLRIPGLLGDERQPADFELGSRGDDEVRAARARDQARLAST